MITCTRFLGGTIDVPIDSLSYRPSAYGIVVKEGEILLLTNEAIDPSLNPKWWQIPSLKPEQMQVDGEEIIRSLKQRAG